MELTRSSVPVAGVPTPVWSAGAPNGVPVILVHGFRGDHHGLALIAENMLKLAAAKGLQIRVLVPDLPGFGQHGLLKRPHDLPGFGRWLRDFAEEVAPEGCFLVAHSFGTLVAAQALALGLKPRAVTLINPISAPALKGPQKLLTQAAISYYKLGAKLPEKPANFLLGNRAIVRVMSIAMAKTRDKELRRFIHDQHDRYFSVYASRKSLLEAFRASVENTVADFAPHFQMPVQLIAGEIDDITALSEQLRLKHLLRDARLHVIGGVGHLIHYEAPREAAEVTVEFLLRQSLGEK
ncbi:MAG: alpha/beta hydrolase [Microbacteriaceae bacterium]|nr:alpha/beta hydrolase [Microbacteriaceae bacterium]